MLVWCYKPLTVHMSACVLMQSRDTSAQSVIKFTAQEIFFENKYSDWQIERLLMRVHFISSGFAVFATALRTPMATNILMIGEASLSSIIMLM